MCRARTSPSQHGPGCRLLLALLVRGGHGTSWVDPCEESVAQQASASVNQSVLDEVLRTHVSYGEIGGIQTTLVDYAALRQDPSRLREYLRQLCGVDVHEMAPAEALAVLVNAYNAIMLAIVVHYAPAGSVNELHSRVPGGSIWTHPFATLGGERVSLDDVEHRLIRRGGFASRFGAAGRVHAAINCASLSCPDLLPEAFRASDLENQLNNATRGWLANPTKNPGPDGSGAVVLNKIFKWYAGDFQEAAGSVQAFVRTYSSWQVSDGATLRFADYDWSLNVVGGVSSSGAHHRFRPAVGALGALALAMACQG